MLAASATDPATIFAQCEHYKQTYLDTDRLATEAGFIFTPMVCEAHSGAWSSTARRKLDLISKTISSATGESTTASSLRVAQRISIALHKANARAILQRLSGLASSASADITSADAAAWAEVGLTSWQ